MARIGAPSLHTFFIISSFLLFSQIHARSLERTTLEKAAITVEGLSYDYYSESCPSVETIVREHLKQVFAEESAIGPGILRLFFHDCFSEGCDGSIFLDGENGEMSNLENSGFRDDILPTIENLHAQLQKQCLGVVSCSDILILAAREAVRQYGGPDFDVPLGRKDSLTFNISSPSNLPLALATAEKQLEIFEKKNFDATELVALSGAHTYGVAHCGSLRVRIKEEQPPIEPEFNNSLVFRCKNENQTSFSPAPLVYLDKRSPYKFDNMYYIDLLNNQGVLTTDQALTTDPRTKEVVNSFASDEELFFEKFAKAFVKVSQLNVLTGDDGEIRKSCFNTNSKAPSMVQEVVELVENI